MEFFRDLYIKCDDSSFDALMKGVEKTLPGGWTRDFDAEAHMHSGGISSRLIYCFSSPTDGSIPAATIFLFEKSPGTFYVSNIVPSIKTELSYREYNSVLETFTNAIVRPIADQLGINIELTKDNIDIDDFMNAGTAKLLRVFSVAANKSTGSSHPLDQERWLRFVAAAHAEVSRLDASTLRRWLMETQGWPEETADQLAIEYEFGRALLSSYDGKS